MKTDAELLKSYAETRCEAAFSELVHRYVDLVYSTAVRQVAGDASLAEDVTQSVFIDLARKAKSLSAHTILSGWLYTSARYASAKAVRGEQRRRAREETCTMDDSADESATEPKWDELRPVLDDAMHELNERDRNAVLLRYFEGRQLAEVGARLGLSEDAARMRVTRALERLRVLLAKRGVTSTTAGLAVLLTHQTITAAPAGLALNVAGTALAGAATITGNTFTLLNLMATTKLKIGLITAAAVTLATPLAVQHHIQTKVRQENQSLRQRNEELRALAGENERLSNLLAQVQAREAARDDSSVELLKLRGEVARLREDARELARLKSSATSENDPSIEGTLKSLAARATQLKRHLDQVPARRIPELQLISDKEWIDAAAKTPLETEDDYRQALNKLRSSAKSALGSMMQKALKQYAQANDMMLPTDLSQLLPYFDRPVDASLLQRYQIAQSGRLQDANQALIVEVAPPVDDEYDTLFKFHLNGTSTHSVNQTLSALEAATRAYAAANNGLLPRDPFQLAPYLQQPIDPTRLQKYFDKLPANVTTLEQLQALRR